MKRFLFFSLLATLSLSSSNSSAQNFSYNIFKQIDSKSNFCISPYNIASSLNIARHGAKGQTSDEIAFVLETETEPIVQEESLQIGNALFLSSDTKILDSFKLEIPNLCTVTQSDFSKPDLATKTINSWVSEQTKKRITKAISQTYINAQTKMVIVNSISFDGTWENKFDPTLTEISPFFTGDWSEVVKAEMMKQIGQFKYAETDEAQIVEMPYKDSNLSMVLVLPKWSVEQIKERMNATKIKSWLSELKEETLFLMIPKFKISTDLDLSQNLVALGITTAFTDEADFSGITGTRDLKISKVIHNTTLSVEENGTEAASSTAVVLTLKCLGNGQCKSPILFGATHPFIFMIRDRKTNSILFIGQMTNPSPDKPPFANLQERLLEDIGFRNSGHLEGSP